MKPKAAIYLRVSTDAQTVEHQRPACLELARANGWLPYVVEETASGSGAKRRNGWEEVERLAAEKQIAAVVVWSLDRLGRSIWAVCDAVRKLDAAGVRIASVNEPWLDVGNRGDSTAEPLRFLLMSVFAFVADMERRKIIDRTRAAHVTARRQGKRIGRARVLDGTDLEAAVRLRLAGKSWGDITREFAGQGKPFAKSTISAAVTRLIEARL